MLAVRRFGALLFVLLIGIFIGTLGWKSALFIVAPLFLIWLMLWDEKKYRRFTYKEQRKKNHYGYKH